MLCVQQTLSRFVELFTGEQGFRLLLAAQTTTQSPLLDSFYHAAAVEIPVVSGE